MKNNSWSLPLNWFHSQIQLALPWPMKHPSSKFENQPGGFLCNRVDRQTNRTENITSMAEVVSKDIPTKPFIKALSPYLKFSPSCGNDRIDYSLNRLQPK